MNISRLTVPDIAQLLTQQDLQPGLIERLKTDSRQAVARLVDKWLKNQAKIALEKQRLQALYAYERELYSQGYQLIAGVDEAGRGPVAGPVVIGTVILPRECYLPLLNDSKQLTPARREELYTVIHEVAVAVGYIAIDVETIDTINIYQATVQGMYSVLENLAAKPEAVLIDAVPLRRLKIPNHSIIDGDALSASIAAASIIAKVERDRIMMHYDSLYPEYGFANNKGYGTREHREAIMQYGPCPIHRQSFEPVKSMLATVEPLPLVLK